ncbi:MAG: POT family proton-dependent oligopeptide transporter, partial [Myxococcota bacterium]
FVEKVFQAFYFIINFGSFFATLMIPWLRAEYGNSVAFGLPGILMLVATFVFWMGRKDFVHVPAKPGGKLGLYDTAGATLFFLTFGSLFFTATMSIWVILAVSGACFAGGLAVHGARQKIEKDDGFVSIALSTIKKGWAKTKSEYGDDSVDGPVAVMRIISVFFLVSVFWALFDQHASSWIRQAQSMDLHVNFGIWEGDLLPSQIGALNPLMVMGLIPFASFLLYPTMNKMGFTATPLRRMSIGMFMAALAYVTVAMIQQRIETEGVGTVSVAWQILPYLIITLSEVMVSITGLEFAYTQAPQKMKSTLMGFWLLTVAMGNVLVAVLTAVLPADMSLSSAFWMYTAMMAGAAVVFSISASMYKGKTYTQ